MALEPDEHHGGKAYEQTLVEDGIPFTVFAVDDVAAEHERLAASASPPRSR